eukprot:CAMPEP_0176462472 /NCGR_PEP_ID=MMETSP0127-20121128/35290_1 /TAXON_ID=938130 /ORGANISM="Platyophrya macrostoma, Strain WH" /LENGTH=263 /DNA_ID=CAMNT_0017854401 /DNA_START=132 /DNA_END=926 /DNA_ORIENTATION=+
MKSKGYKTLFSEQISNGPFTSEAFSIYYKSTKNQIIISFRGTNQKLQLIQEFLQQGGSTYTLQPGFSNIRIMSYFYDHYNGKLRNQLLDSVNKAKRDYPSASFIIIGHSLGGAYASLAAFDLATSGVINKQSMQVYTYGSPRVGNYEFAKAFKDTGVSVFRIVSAKDPIPHGPSCKNDGNNECSKGPQGSGSAWAPYHLDDEVYYPDPAMRSGQYSICREESAKCARSVNLLSWDVNNHLYYFGKRIGCPDGRTVMEFLEILE